MGDETPDRGRIDTTDAYDHDVVVVGGGPAGSSAAVFCARGGLDTVVFDRGNSSIRRCGYLENYLGFPAGVDISTFCDLLADHVERAGAERIADLVGSIERDDDDGGVFRVQPQEGATITTRFVVAATKYDSEYLRGLDDGAAMFETAEYDGETREIFDDSYPDADGRTPVDGLYVSGPLGSADDQAIIAAGHGARVGRAVLADDRVESGWWPEVADRVDWVRREAERDEQWSDRDRWREWFDDRFADGAPVAVDTDRYRRVRRAYIDAALGTYIDAEEIAARTEAGQRALAEQLDTEAVLESVDDERLLEAVDDEAIRAYLDEEVVDAC
jgi:glycine/D-amino acid oxidase-like deaminating enzyme